jgi:hypothetical protein
MASRGAVKIHVHPRSLLSAASYSLFKTYPLEVFTHRMVSWYVLGLGGTQILSLIFSISCQSSS